MFPFANILVANPLEKPSPINQEEAEDILSSLLHNVYRAFDHHDDELIYDGLARSIAGDLLTEVYLETRKSMEVKNQGGLRISVKEVELTNLHLLDNNPVRPIFRCSWRVSGWIGHWGHIHQRENEHEAEIIISEMDGVWKIVAMEMLGELPIDPSSPITTQANATP